MKKIFLFLFTVVGFNILSCDLDAPIHSCCTPIDIKCGKSFLGDKVFHDHLIQVHKACPICKANEQDCSEWKGGIRGHYSQQHAAECSECSAHFFNPDKLNEHMQSDHRSVIQIRALSYLSESRLREHNRED